VVGCDGWWAGAASEGRALLRGACDGDLDEPLGWRPHGAAVGVPCRRRALQRRGHQRSEPLPGWRRRCPGLARRPAGQRRRPPDAWGRALRASPQAAGRAAQRRRRLGAAGGPGVGDGWGLQRARPRWRRRADVLGGAGRAGGPDDVAAGVAHLRVGGPGCEAVRLWSWAGHWAAAFIGCVHFWRRDTAARSGGTARMSSSALRPQGSLSPPQPAPARAPGATSCGSGR
jgi:hypothetical protein